MNKETIYPEPMLIEVDYQQFDEDFDSLSELEYGVMENLRTFLKKLEHSLLNAKMIQSSELLVANLCCYLGAITAVYDANKSKELEATILEIIEQHANFAFANFNRHPVNSAVGDKHKKHANLEQLRKNSPGSIVVQTVRLGRVVMDMMDSLKVNRDDVLGLQKKQTELFCPQNEFFAFLIPLIDDQHHKWQKMLCDKSINYAINQIAIQIAWLIGYFAHLDNQLPSDGQYLAYSLPCIGLFLGYTNELLQAMRAKGKILTSLQNNYDAEPKANPNLESLLGEIRELSIKAHTNLPPTIIKWQKKTMVVNAALEKLLIELIMEKMAIKVIFMSLFYFWFTLDAPLRFKNPKDIDNCEPFDQMHNIIDLVKSISRSLPDPKLSPELKKLNAKMQALKSNLSNPASYDEVSQDVVEHQTTRVNTAIHTLTSVYLRQEYHPEIIANVLFSQWLRLSVFYGVSENDWQKMDYYLKEILTAVRNYLPTIFE